MQAASSLPGVEGPLPSITFDFFGKIPATPWRLCSKDLTDRAKVVLGALTILARGRSGWIRATQREIAEACGKSVRAVQRAIRELVSKEIVHWEAIGRNFVFLFQLRGGQPASREPINSAPQNTCIGDRSDASDTTDLSCFRAPP